MLNILLFLSKCFSDVNICYDIYLFKAGQKYNLTGSVEAIKSCDFCDFCIYLFYIFWTTWSLK